MSRSLPKEQLPLRISLQDSATFDNFYSAGNAALIHVLQHDSEAFVYLWGKEGTGKSHLLQAACHQAASQNQPAVYLPVPELVNLDAEMLAGLESMALVCIDDIQAVANKPHWQTALFHLYNRVRETGSRLIVSGNAAPPALEFSLQDLTSRLGWGPVFQLLAMEDEDKISALQMRAKGRGMDLPHEVASYLLRHTSRDWRDLFILLERLDTASLSAQRKLTIPFVKELI